MEKLTAELYRSLSVARLRFSMVEQEIEELRTKINDNLAYLETVKERLEAHRRAHDVS